MKKALVTGGAGFIGYELCKALLRKGFDVTATYRGNLSTSQLEQKIKWLRGDITDEVFLGQSLKGQQFVFHVAAYAKPYAPTYEVYHRINIVATKLLLDIAITHQIEKVVVTSSAGALGWQENENWITEEANPSYLLTYYDRSKLEVNKLVQRYADKIPVVGVSPTRVFGPGKRSKSNAVTEMIFRYQKGKWYFLPGNGEAFGNYVFINDVVKGHLLAMEKGRSGEQYILGGTNLTYRGFFEKVANLTGRKRPLLPLPFWVMNSVGWINELLAKSIGIAPLITRPWIKKYNLNTGVSHQKAQMELGYHPTPFEEGVAKTLAHHNQH